MTRSLLSPLLVLFVFGSCRERERPPERLPAIPQNAMAAVFETVIGPPPTKSHMLYCLDLAHGSVWHRPPKHDPPVTLITVLSQRGYSVRPGSRCTVSQDSSGRLVEQGTRRLVTTVTLEDSLVAVGDSLRDGVVYSCGWLCAAIGSAYIWQVDRRWIGRFNAALVS